MMLPVQHLLPVPSKPHESFESFAVSEEGTFALQSEDGKPWGTGTASYNGRTLTVAFPEEE